MESEINSLGNNVKSLRLMIEKHEMELEAKDKKIEQLEEELKEETIRADEAAFDVAKLEKTVGSRLPTKFVLISKARILMH